MFVSGITSSSVLSSRFLKLKNYPLHYLRPCSEERKMEGLTPYQDSLTVVEFINIYSCKMAPLFM